ncbi:putative quinol monooxygenase [Echinimonas agarilytica]|uniref:Antibiotic biosynthesis monooxygenase n=1 Tax=Echinimonas agarilytica TaxID=1215918 RepID=A0AA41W5J7_9GAMM|nr:antibiotic biosynthesis monooxygenase family protein [Echinimonas agarilytica]MCM2679055.1 antibiotic biosynthesis monooxygenase [Echinimonas agarilytica]
MTVTRINEFQAAEGKAEELFNFLTSLMSSISSSKGCLSCELLRHTESSRQFLVIEKWQSVEEHQASVQSFPKQEMQLAMQFLGAAPKGNYYF